MNGENPSTVDDLTPSQAQVMMVCMSRSVSSVVVGVTLSTSMMERPEAIQALLMTLLNWASSPTEEVPN